MTAVFLKLLNISITASWIVLAVVLVRLFLRKTPRWIVCILWGIVALRLVLPFTFESRLSLVPDVEVPVQRVVQQQDNVTQLSPSVTMTQTEKLTTESAAPVDYLQAVSILWLCGTAGMVLYSVISYGVLRRKVRASIHQERNIYFCDNIGTAFILGFLRPRIYIPSDLEPNWLQYVLTHEEAHIKRKDHWWKPVGFVLLSVYWFNPLLWLGYILLCRDIEQACDEKAVADMDTTEKKHYSEALIACSIPRRVIRACPVAFGEVAIKDRIKGVFHYKKPSFWVLASSIALCCIVAVCFLTDPKSCEHQYTSQVTTESTCSTEGTMTYTCKHCDEQYTKKIPVISHQYGEAKTVQAPSCIQVGYRERICTQCGATTREEIGTCGHSAGEITVLTAASCTQPGTMTSVCTVCNQSFRGELAPDPHNHDMQQKVIRAATCSHAGEGVNTCTRCGYSETISYPQLSHSFVDYGLLCKTCDIHERQQICTGCNYIQKVTLDDYGHNWVNGKCSTCFMVQPRNDRPAGVTVNINLPIVSAGEPVQPYRPDPYSHAPYSFSTQKSIGHS